MKKNESIIITPYNIVVTKKTGQAKKILFLITQYTHMALPYEFVIYEQESDYKHMESDYKLSWVSLKKKRTKRKKKNLSIHNWL